MIVPTVEVVHPASLHITRLHFVGYGYLSDDFSETVEAKIANVLCMIYDNAPRGYSRVYLRNGKRWEGPRILKGEMVVLTA